MLAMGKHKLNMSKYDPLPFKGLPQKKRPPPIDNFWMLDNQNLATAGD